MKRLGGLWEQVVSFENLLLAYRKARKGKANRKEVVWFSLELEKELLRIQLSLEQQIWTPGKYRIFTIYERKPRQISAAPFRDRVFHHALMNVLEPLLDKRFIYDTHACRAGHGVHLAVSRYQSWAKTRAYALKLDISGYFPSIDQAILKQQLHDWRQAIDEELAKIRLTIHPRKANVFQTALGVDVLGYQVFPSYRKLRNDNGYRFVRRLNGFADGYQKGRLEWDDFNPSVQSWIGHAQQADTFNLRRSIFDSTVFRREKR